MFKVILIVCFFSFSAFSHDDLEEISVHGALEGSNSLSHIDKNSVVKKEILTKDRIEHKNATSLARAVDLEPGVQTAITCASCGSQRLTLNGLRGENTTLLIDGIPAFSTVSSFYGLEAIPMTGIGSIEIMRGSGAAAVTPDSVGGAVNLVTASTQKHQFLYHVRGGEHGFFNQQLLGIYDGFMIAAQTNQLNAFDEDENKIAESSRTLQKSFFLKKENRLGDKAKFYGRFGHQELELLGGSARSHRPGTFTTNPAEENNFPGGDVRKDYDGSLAQVADWIRLKRTDGGGSLTYHVNDTVNLKGSFALASQEQLSTYFHGYDYDNHDMYRFFDLKLNSAAGESHFLTMGVDHRHENMVSNSDFLYRTQDFHRDNFRFNTLGFYVQDEWALSARSELNLVARVERLKVNWADSRLSHQELDKTVLAPRIHFKHQHSDLLTSRLSYGMGYRAPLTLFESQHGTNEEGFDLKIKDIEKAHTVTYTLNNETKKRSSAASVAFTRLENMAYGDDHYEPMIFRNAARHMDIKTVNFLHVERVTATWNLEAGFDWFILPDDYKKKLPVAAQETRARLVSDWHFGKNELVGFLNIVGPRNLRKYGYERNYNVFDGTTASSRKNQNAPMYATIDLFFNHSFSRNVSSQFGVNNLLDYTQTKAHESPLSWRSHGEHTHMDNRHIWGPLQGRVLYAGFKVEI